MEPRNFYCGKLARLACCSCWVLLLLPSLSFFRCVKGAHFLRSAKREKLWASCGALKLTFLAQLSEEELLKAKVFFETVECALFDLPIERNMGPLLSYEAHFPRSANRGRAPED